MRHAALALVLIAGTASADPVPYNTLFLNRCASGCPVRPGNPSSIADTFGITGQHTLTAFDDGDDKWNQVVACVRDVLEIADIDVTDVDPGTADHFEVMVAGSPTDLGQPNGIGDLAAFSCSGPYVPDALAFSFSKVWHGSVEDICTTTIQAFEHNFELDHVAEASDPLSYFTFTGRRYIRDMAWPCGSDCQGGLSPFEATCSGPNGQLHACSCGGAATQNAYQTLRALFGPGTPTPPSVAITMPADGAHVVGGFAISATATDDGAVSDPHLAIDGVEAIATSLYQYTAPATLADGAHTVTFSASDAHGTIGSTTITVTSGTAVSGDAGTSDPMNHPDGGGCCQAGSSGSLPLGLATLALLRRRRRATA